MWFKKIFHLNLVVQTHIHRAPHTGRIIWKCVPCVCYSIEIHIFIGMFIINALFTLFYSLLFGALFNLFGFASAGDRYTTGIRVTIPLAQHIFDWTSMCVRVCLCMPVEESDVRIHCLPDVDWDTKSDKNGDNIVIYVHTYIQHPGWCALKHSVEHRWSLKKMKKIEWIQFFCSLTWK